MFDALNLYEINILDFIQKTFRCGFLDTVVPYVTALGDGGIFFIVCAVLFLIFKKTRSIGIAIAAALILEAVVVNLTMKPLLMRERPFSVNPDILLLVKAPGDYSFPSGHSATAFAFAAAVFFMNKKWGIPAFIVAALVALSRLYLYVHYPTDVLAGILIGIILGAFAAFAVKHIEKSIKKRKTA
ncbi:MAG: phosphatase PAP2 family protein [Clostridiales bacterium]|jgi:undecaprenyl-diphosphatase|nr:phosphatase PAP2 family protein [Clostridiales bacterium]